MLSFYWSMQKKLGVKRILFDQHISWYDVHSLSVFNVWSSALTPILVLVNMIQTTHLLVTICTLPGLCTHSILTLPLLWSAHNISLYRFSFCPWAIHHIKSIHEFAHGASQCHPCWAAWSTCQQAAPFYQSCEQVFCALSEFWNSGNLKCSIVVFKNSTVDLCVTRGHWESSCNHFLPQVHDWDCISDGIQQATSVWSCNFHKMGQLANLMQ